MCACVCVCVCMCVYVCVEGWRRRWVECRGVVGGCVRRARGAASESGAEGIRRECRGVAGEGRGDCRGVAGEGV